MAIAYQPEPFRIKMVETIKMLTKEERMERIAAAKYNLFNLASRDVYIDLLTDSGTGAMSAEQWAGVMRGDESYAGASSFFKLEAAGCDIFGYEYIMPVHQGRAAEKVLFPALLSKGKYAISNMFFDTTRAHVEIAGARAVDCVVEEAKNPAHITPFKGNMDVALLEKKIQKLGADSVGLVVMTITNNSAGGQPVSMANMRDTAAVCRKYGLPLAIDAARFAENAYFIKTREDACKDMSIKAITREMFGYADMFVMSAKKDGIVNIGGLIGVKNSASDVVLKLKANCISFEGFYTYGGMAGRDLEALSIGLYESINEDYLRYRIGQMAYLASLLDDAGIGYQKPVGGHGVFLDAKAMYPDIPYYEFPAQVLCVELYKEAGVRASAIDSYMLGNDPDTGKQLQAEFEFCRLAIPRRVYTQAHLDQVAAGILRVAKNAHAKKRGFRITWEPPILRHFQASLAPIE